MAQRSRAQQLNGLFPLSYMGVVPVSPANFIMDDRAPTINDSKNFYIGDMWLDTSSLPAIPPTTSNLWILVALVGNIATWRNFASGVAALQTLTGNSGGAVGVDAFDNINTVGDGITINVVGNPATNTLTISTVGTGVMSSLTGDFGGAVFPLAGNTNILGTTNVISVTGNPGTHTLTLNTGSNVATSYITNPATGTAVPTAGVLTFAGAGGTTVSAAGSTVTISSSAVASSTVITTYSGAGAGNHTLNALAKAFTVIGWAAGSGGGSGRQGVTTAAGGGAGGGGGAMFIYDSPSVFFGGGGGVVPYVVGAGGAGGAAQAGANTNGNPGVGGGLTSFGNIKTALPFALAVGGTVGVSSPGSAKDSFSVTVYANGGFSSSGGTGSNVLGTNGTDSTHGTALPTGGGGGSGGDTGVIRQAGNGANIVTADLGTTVLLGGAGGIESGTIDGANGSDGTTAVTAMVGGTGGGGGGGQSAGIVAGIGGNGGFPGGGGGGGGGSINGTSSGAGGAGADGQLIVIEYL